MTSVVSIYCNLAIIQKTHTTAGGGFPSKYLHPVWYGKTRMVWLPDGEKIHERDRQTDGQTERQTQHDGIGRAYA